jgi:hypothetical protein
LFVKSARYYITATNKNNELPKQLFSIILLVEYQDPKEQNAAIHSHSSLRFRNVGLDYLKSDNDGTKYEKYGSYGSIAIQ